jgi:hypothetical protein
VRNPRGGQTVALSLPEGIKLADGHEAKKPVDAAASAGAYAQVNWLVVSGPRVEGRRELTARLEPDGADGRAAIEVVPGDLTH